VRRPDHRRKLLSRAAAARAVRAAQRRGERVVLTGGCFDLLHVGHARSPRRRTAWATGWSSASTPTPPCETQGRPRPIVPARQRAELIAALACVDWVVIFAEPTPRELIAALGPDVYAKGGDWPLAVLRAKDAPPSFRGSIRRLRQVPGLRTSALVERIRGG
jgi:D-beta-D-heptose 7-phosphate kinase/D-beta-D-heptose 1-phosphate adenosyltransferase